MTEFHIVTLFPEFFKSPLQTSLLAKAIDKGIVKFTFHNPRDFSSDKHRHVDDTPYGGGPGMIIKADVLLSALRSIKDPGAILLMNPAGELFNQDIAAQLSLKENITLVCGRYEGIDERAIELGKMRSICLCDAILNGGETAALAVIEAVCRLLPDFMGKCGSADCESFNNALLEYPHYTRPEIFEDKKVPQVLLSGHHKQIEAWQRQKALERTLCLRPDLLEKTVLTDNDIDILAQIPRIHYGRNLSFCLFHSPVMLENNKSGISSLTNLDIHDIARISESYGMGFFYVLTPLRDQLHLLETILNHWKEAFSALRQDRRNALQNVIPVANTEELEAHILDRRGIKPIFITTSATWPKKKTPIPFSQIPELAKDNHVIICLGTARGLDMAKLSFEYMQLQPLRYLDANHLSVRSAAAIIADRIMGDFH